MLRNETKEISIGKVKIGGTNPIAIQSMTNTKTEDVAATVAQVHALEKAGCEIIRCAVPTMEAAAVRSRESGALFDKSRQGFRRYQRKRRRNTRQN